MSEVTTKKAAKPVTIVDEVEVVIEPNEHHWHYWGGPTEEKRMKRLQEFAREVKEFIRDHRSMDVHDVRVVERTRQVCSLCNETWEAVRCEADGDEPAYIGCSYCCEPMESTDGN